ncbi:MAG: response regulator [Phycisphaerae bacterium]|nr:response regulator [Phycisphaerae bacterium]
MAAKATNLSTFAIAELLHVDPGSVANWIDQGLLKAHRTPGGHRRVQVDDLVKFLREHKMPIPAELDTTPIRVLVVDDEEGVAKLIARALRAQFPNFEVVEANDGFRAGTTIATIHPDVVILDLRMPGMDGYEVCRMIKAQDATRHAEVIAMTAFPSPESEQRILDCGARVCLSKPLDLDSLLKEVEKSL